MKALLVPVLALTCGNVFAEEDLTPDPSDLTQVNSFANVVADSEDTMKVIVGVAGQYNEGNSFMGLIDHGVNTKTGAQNSRVRYFQVFDVETSIMPQIGGSIDYMKGWKHKGMETNIVALGGIAKITTPWSNVSIYPNAALVTGDITHKTSGTGMKQSIDGYQANIFGSIALSEDGNYIMLQPQWMDTNVGSKLEVRTSYGHPLTSDGKTWVDFNHIYTKVEGSGPLKNFGAETDNKFEIGLSYYF
ncbi:hypothetical protein C9J48_13370 [Photobacterium profundum]|uniref:Outer membrane protein beta-barrel domain-containing protein n=1 Tax=Photobacterium profundum 3TCK TaxID=314280 RepID=Q1Z3D1_9GAMM|nr:hypothetical protein [Photobacterium profundum]EAS43075.1 hypothetical protein P3TCK_11534 [Photobacterium profundum 3TCK]PSV61973.1 hypothetical protein C9J48_13370 [Photobacterium profundum]